MIYDSSLDDGGGKCDCHVCSTDVKSMISCVRCKLCYFKNLEISYPNASIEELESCYNYSPYDSSMSERLKCKLGSRNGFSGWICCGCIDSYNVETHEVVKTPIVAVSDCQKDVLMLKEETAMIKEKLDRVLSLIESSSNVSNNEILSPRRKSVCISPPSAAMKTSSNSNDNVLNPNLSMTKPVSYSNIVKVNLKTNGSEPLGNIMKTLHDNRKDLPVLTSRRKLDGSIDALFNSYGDACKAKEIFEKNLSSLSSSKPLPSKFEKYRLSGLGFYMSVEDTVDAILEENKSWLDFDKISDSTLQLKNDPLSVLKVLNVSKCHMSDDYKVIVSMSPNLVHTIGFNKLSIGLCKCNAHKFTHHNRCYKCQEPGHFAAKCTNEQACSRCSLKHSASECTSTHFKCVNCSKHGRVPNNHASYSDICPFNRIT